MFSQDNTVVNRTAENKNKSIVAAVMAMLVLFPCGFGTL